MRPLAGAPGLYASYDWPTGGAASPDMEVDHTWTTIPDGSNGNGNGVFARVPNSGGSGGAVRPPGLASSSSGPLAAPHGVAFEIQRDTSPWVWQGLALAFGFGCSLAIPTHFPLHLHAI
jgi:hypothetical protein